MKSKCPPDISARPYSMTVERVMTASAEELYEAWTEKFDRWFAEPGEIMMIAEVDRPYFFRNRKDWGSHPHYGRFVELEKNKIVEMTWVTGAEGTGGAETVLRIELTPTDKGTLLPCPIPPSRMNVVAMGTETTGRRHWKFSTRRWQRQIAQSSTEVLSRRRSVAKCDFRTENHTELPSYR